MHGIDASPLPLADKRFALAAKIAVVASVAVVLVAAQRLGVWHQFADPAHAKQVLLQLGPWGFLAFVIAYATLQPFGIPGTVFVVTAALVWPWPTAFALSMIATLAASVVGFSFARFVARDAVTARIPAQFRKYDEALARKAFLTVVVLRFIFWMPPLLHAFFGVSKVRFWTHFWGSALGYIFPLLAVSYFGQRLFDFAKMVPWEVWVGVALKGVVVAIVGWMVRRRVVRTRAALVAATRREE
ncbi:MAG: TVP38/TMEM64 family protein [Polyangiales bacterium]